MTKDEESLVLQGYNECNGEWEKIVDFMKERVMMLPGDYLRKSKTNEYYQTATSKAAIKRLQRIVNQSLKKASEPSSSSQTSATSQIPSARQTLTTDPSSMATVIKQSKERYSKKSTPEERRARAKFNHAVHLDSSSSGSEAADMTEAKTETVKTEAARGQKRRKRHDRGKRAAKEAHKAHKEMCTKAMKMMERIDTVLNKYESSDSE